MRGPLSRVSSTAALPCSYLFNKFIFELLFAISKITTYVLLTFSSASIVLSSNASRHTIYFYLAIQVQQIKRGDEVLVKTDKDLVKGLQVDHGGWNEAMVSVSQEQNLLVIDKK